MARSWAPLPPPKRGPIACDWAGHSHRDTLWKESLKPFLTNNTGIIHPCNSTCLQTHTPHTTCVQVHTHTPGQYIYTHVLSDQSSNAHSLCVISDQHSAPSLDTHTRTHPTATQLHTAAHIISVSVNSNALPHTHTPPSCVHIHHGSCLSTQAVHTSIFFTHL